MEANGAASMHQPKTFSDIAEPFAELSHREQQVIALVCDGISNKEIAEKLGVTEGTVKIHLHSIYEQLGVRSRIELMIALANRSKSKWLMSWFAIFAATGRVSWRVKRATQINDLHRLVILLLKVLVLT
jgi:DNA-binding CsgD family transcriptional regulator